MAKKSLVGAFQEVLGMVSSAAGFVGSNLDALERSAAITHNVVTHGINKSEEYVETGVLDIAMARARKLHDLEKEAAELKVDFATMRKEANL